MFVPWRWNCWRNTWLKLTWSLHSDQSSWCSRPSCRSFVVDPFETSPSFCHDSLYFFFPIWRALHLKTVLIANFVCFVDFRYFCTLLIHRRAALATWKTHLCMHRVSHRWSHESHLCDLTWFGTLPVFWSPEVFQLLRWGIAMLFWTSRSSQTCWHTAGWNCLPREAAEDHRIASEQLQMIDSFEFLSTPFDLQDLTFKSFARLSHPFVVSICAQATAGYVAKIGKWSDSHDCRLAWLTEDAEITSNSNQRFALMQVLVFVPQRVLEIFYLFISQRRLVWIESFHGTDLLKSGEPIDLTASSDLYRPTRWTSFSTKRCEALSSKWLRRPGSTDRSRSISDGGATGLVVGWV